MTEINNCPINPVELKTTQFMHTAIDPTNAVSYTHLTLPTKA